MAFLTVSVSERPAYGRAPRESVRASIESMYEYEKNLFGPRKEDAERCGNGNVGFFFRRLRRDQIYGRPRRRENVPFSDSDQDLIVGAIFVSVRSVFMMNRGMQEAQYH